MAVGVLWHFLTMRWVGLRCDDVVFPDQTHLLFMRFESKIVNEYETITKTKN